MLHITINLCDILFVASCPGGEGGGSTWSGHCSDHHTGKVMAFSGWTHEQIAAVVALMMSDDWSNEMATSLYETAEPLFVDWPKEFRPIP